MLKRVTMDDGEFQRIREYVYSSIGVNLTEAKRSLVISRLSKRLRELRLNTFSEYLALVERSDKEQNVLFDLITTNVTSFFRESHHFTYLTGVFVDGLLREGRPQNKKVIRVWSAGCSSGEEPYSIAMSLSDFLVENRATDWDFRILASDINSEQIAKAEQGIYKLDEVKGVSEQVLKRFFKIGMGPNAGLVQVKDSLRKRVVFRRINLLSKAEYPIASPVDVVFCRNVFIYFDRDTRKAVSDRFHHHTRPGGLLCIGHSESIDVGQPPKWGYVRHTIYRRI